MKRLLCMVLVATLVIGCNSAQVRFSTLRLSTTIPDIQQVQVLDNLARVAVDPGVLPYYTIATSGTASVSDKGKASGFISFPAQQLVKQLHNARGGEVGPLSVERDITGNWSLKPTNDPNRLAAMRCACQIALGLPDQIHPVDYDRLKTLLAKNYKNSNGNPMEMIPTGWLERGTKWQVPKHWAYVAHCDHTYVWVNPDRLRDFTNFVLIYLDIATLSAAPHRDLPDVPKAKSPDLEKGGGVESQIITNLLNLPGLPNLWQTYAAESTEHKQLSPASKSLATMVSLIGQQSRDARENEARARAAEAYAEALRAALTRSYSYDMPARTDDAPTYNPGLFFIPR